MARRHPQPRHGQGFLWPRQGRYLPGPSIIKARFTQGRKIFYLIKKTILSLPGQLAGLLLMICSWQMFQLLEIILPINVFGGYGGHTRRFCWFGDKGRIWQARRYLDSSKARGKVCCSMTGWGGLWLCSKIIRGYNDNLFTLITSPT